MFIDDGVGTGKRAKVDTNNDIRTHSKNVSQRDHACNSGDKFNINTGDVTMTDATVTSVLYIKNNEDSDLVITSLMVIIKHYNVSNIITMVLMQIRLTVWWRTMIS